MVSLEQLQQLRELIYTVVARIQAFEQENVRLHQKLLEYENNIDDLSEENRGLEKNQQLVEVEVGEILNELRGIQFEEVEIHEMKQVKAKQTRAGQVPIESIPVERIQVEKKPKIPQSSDNWPFLGQRKNVDPKQVGEINFEHGTENIEAADMVSAVQPQSSEALNQDLNTVQIKDLPQSSAASESATINAKPLDIEKSLDLATEMVDLAEEISHSLDVSLGLGGDNLLILEGNLSSLESQKSSDDDLEIF